MRSLSRVKVRPTARGWQAILAGALVLALAAIFGTTQLYQLAYALGGLLVAALALGFFSSRALEIYRQMPKDVRIKAGETSRIGLLLANTSRFRGPRADVLDRVPDLRSFEAPVLDSREDHIVETPVTFERRGVYRIGPAEIRSFDLFELWRFTRKAGGRTDILVYPETFDLSGFPVHGGSVEAGSRGAHASRGEDFSGLREYRRGDDRRHIHWKSVARTGELIVKEFSVDAPRRYSVVLDLYRGGLRSSQSEVEAAVSAAGSVLGYLLQEALTFRLVCTDKAGSASEFGAGEVRYWEAMGILATVRADGDHDPAGFIREEREQLGEGAILISRDADRRGGSSASEALPASIRELRSGGMSATVVALATHTYDGSGNSPRNREREKNFREHLRRLEEAGAEVLAARKTSGVAGLSGGHGGRDRAAWGAS